MFDTMEEETRKKKRGGARAGAGRPRVAVRAVPFTVAMVPAQAERLRAMAKAEGLPFGAFVVRLMDEHERRRGCHKPDTLHPRHKPETLRDGHKPESL